MDTDRRVLLAGAAVGAALMTGAAAEPTPGAPQHPPAKPGDFDFLAGEWRIENRRLAPGTDMWDAFPGEATCWTILAGAGSVEELRIPARQFSGIGLRLIDRARGVWIDHWVNAASGVVSLPGQQGGFCAGGVGTFFGEWVDAGQTILVRGIWDEITPTSHRWRQATSRDKGATWQDNWIMHWRRVSEGIKA